MISTWKKFNVGTRVELEDGAFGKIVSVTTDKYFIILDDGTSREVPFSFVKRSADSIDFNPKLSHIDLKDFKPDVNHTDRNVV